MQKWRYVRNGPAIIEINYDHVNRDVDIIERFRTLADNDIFFLLPFAL